MERLWRESQGLLNGNWRAVESPAHALLERNELNGRSAHRIMRLASKTT
jgi:hypothetical protein